LIRSVSDSNITYTVSETNEAPGTTQYIRSDGTMNVKVVFQVIYKYKLTYDLLISGFLVNIGCTHNLLKRHYNTLSKSVPSCVEPD
jgi:hypothetical protein